MKRWTPEMHQRVKDLRYGGMHPEAIAQVMQTSQDNIERLLTRYRHEGHDFPPLRHGNLKWDILKVREWRDLVKDHWKHKDIAAKYGTHTKVITQRLSMEVRGEL